MRSSALVALMVIAMLVGGVAAYANSPNPASSINIDLKNVSVRQAIDTLFAGQGLKYYIQPGVEGQISELKLKGVSLDEALTALGGAVGFSYRVEEGGYIISPGKTTQQPTAAPLPPSQLIGKGPSAEKPAAAATTPPVVVNNNITVPEQSPVAPLPEPYGGYFPLGYAGGWWPTLNIGTPYVYGRFSQPPPPPGWVSADQERLLRFQYSVPRMPGYIAPYPYFRP
ncbi:MAG: STN domain-containing protein [Armatimonadota bacterium]|jgi:hypothetical protein